MSHRLVRSQVAAICVAVIAVFLLPASAQDACDRACLTRVADAWFAAIAAHVPAKAPIAPAARFTEQTQTRQVGEGLWKTASEAPTTFKIYVADQVAGQIGGIVMMKDAGKPIQVAVKGAGLRSVDVPPPDEREGPHAGLSGRHPRDARHDDAAAVRHGSGAHHQGSRPQDSRDQGDRDGTAVQFAERLERFPALTHTLA